MPGRCPECEDELRRTTDAASTDEGGDRVTSDENRTVVTPTKSSGQRLPPATRLFFQSRMGYRFDGVRVHTGRRADAAARAVGARAFTLGQHVVFRAGEYRPGTMEGTRLLAHELTHVAQQSGERVSAASETISRAGRGIQRQSSLTPSLGQADDAENRCVSTEEVGSTRQSTDDISVAYSWERNEEEREAGVEIDRAEIYLQRRGAPDIKLASETVNQERGVVTFDAGISIPEENDRYQFRMELVRANGSRRHAVRPVSIRFQVCELADAPSGVSRMFAKMIYAEASRPAEYPWVRDVVYNRIEWVRNCPWDRNSFGDPNVRAVLTHDEPIQFATVVHGEGGFEAMEEALNERSGPCVYTTSPRAVDPEECRQINAAIATGATGNENTHDYLFFRSDTRRPSPRAVNMTQYPRSNNHYWEISGCPGRDDVNQESDS